MNPCRYDIEPPLCLEGPIVDHAHVIVPKIKAKSAAALRKRDEIDCKNKAILSANPGRWVMKPAARIKYARTALKFPACVLPEIDKEGIACNREANDFRLIFNKYEDYEWIPYKCALKVKDPVKCLNKRRVCMFGDSHMRKLKYAMQTGILLPKVRASLSNSQVQVPTIL